MITKIRPRRMFFRSGNAYHGLAASGQNGQSARLPSGLVDGRDFLFIGLLMLQVIRL
jgi:hypothetical protein